MTSRFHFPQAGAATAFIALLSLMVIACLEPVPAFAQDRSFGIWRNPKNSVHIRVEPCGKSMCGMVVWASDKAKADAQKGSDEPLIGSRLFRDFEQQSAGIWKGKVFVPDMGKTLSGTVTILDDQSIRAQGCLLGQIACKSQTWVRVPQ